ncbi:MAG: sigma-70 family RNA polymerase sigma factor [Phycisphaerales bacterium]
MHPAPGGDTQTPPPAGDRPSAITQVLIEAAAGGPAAQDRLLALVYDELRQIAGSAMAGERRAHTLQPTALVHEAYVRLFGHEGARFESRGHFFKAAADAMRRILIDHARARGAQKRGGGRAALQIEDVAALIEDPNPDGFLALDSAISRLEGVDAGAAAVVRLRFFAGLSETAAAAALGISERTARRDWAYARAWLRETLEREERETGGGSGGPGGGESGGG